MLADSFQTIFSDKRKPDEVIAKLRHKNELF